MCSNTIYINTYSISMIVFTVIFCAFIMFVHQSLHPNKKTTQNHRNIRHDTRSDKKVDAEARFEMCRIGILSICQKFI